MRRLLTAAVAASVLLSASAMAAPSAKFAATYDTTVLTSTAIAGGVNEPPIIEVELATIKVPQGKELVVGVSTQTAIFTETEVKGKKGGGGSATATGSVLGTVYACNVVTEVCEEAKPGQIIFDGRVQILSATLGGVLDTCADTVVVDGQIDVDTECTADPEAIGLLLQTAGAHHYNFLLPNLDAGEYAIVALYTADSDASTINLDPAADCDGTECDNFAAATVVLGPRVVTVEEVRATNDADFTDNF